NPYLQIEQASLHEDLMKALGHLSEKEVEILCLRFGLNGREPMNLSEIARLPEYNVSRERVRQIEAAALKKLHRIPSVRSLLEDYALSA
ncbi:MAG: hypothetical protein K6A92_05200, partial [Lachnospiraceae bacterium]|nr:hypothetical protein [Lachnospiraceae bacterium]